MAEESEQLLGFVRRAACSQEEQCLESSTCKYLASPHVASTCQVNKTQVLDFNTTNMLAIIDYS